MVIVPPGEMAAQLDRVVELAGRHRITPQIVPRKCGAYRLMAASIKVMTFPDAPPLLCTEASCSGDIIDDPASRDGDGPVLLLTAGARAPFVAALSRGTLAV
ncbi:Scr1 family TA system antitoxin-like transcriptional regulator [Streptomyces sp. NPDC048568]|uniref:Scr1 family TA system antitoxin-like transcriptional regulator n=1 Tax=Streptomyces sp. NPDC048568 TaxID=3365571 RepID=UPI00372210A0